MFVMFVGRGQTNDLHSSMVSSKYERIICQYDGKEGGLQLITIWERIVDRFFGLKDKRGMMGIPKCEIFAKLKDEKRGVHL